MSQIEQLRVKDEHNIQDLSRNYSSQYNFSVLLLTTHWSSEVLIVRLD